MRILKIQKEATRTLASHIDTIYLIENSSKYLKFHGERGGRGPLSQPLNPPMGSLILCTLKYLSFSCTRWYNKFYLVNEKLFEFNF